MTSAKLFILGEERELLYIYTNYYKHIANNGSPTSDINGGLIHLSFISQEDDDVFFHNMLKKVDKETDRMEKGEIHFYSKGDKDIPVKKYEFNDAYLIRLSEVFYADSPDNMIINLTISPAIQNYGTPVDFIKSWQVSWIPPADPVYYVPKEEEEDRIVYVNGYFYTRNGFYLGKIGSGDNVHITSEATFLELQKGKDVSKDQIIYFTEIYELTNTQVLDRANWAYAEGHGYAPEYYAFAMNNFKKVAGSEKKLYSYGMQDIDPKTKKTRSLEKNKYLSGGYENQSGKPFWDTRIDLSKMTNEMKGEVAAVFKTQLQPDKDPTNGCDQWRGGKGSGEIQFNLPIGSKFWHRFFELEKTKKYSGQAKIITL